MHNIIEMIQSLGYIRRMASCNELSRAAGHEIIEDDDVVIVDDKKVEDRVKDEVDSLEIDNCCIDHETN